MAIFDTKRGRQQQLKAELEDVRDKRTEAREAERELEKRIRTCFTEDGGVTRAGLEIELTRLYKKRNEELRPEDTVAQCEIHGQANEVKTLKDWKLQVTRELLQVKENIQIYDNEIHVLKQNIKPKE